MCCYFKLFIFIFGFKLFGLSFQEIIECPFNSIFQLKGGDFVQFESPNFQKSLANRNYKKECNGNFTRSEGKTGLWLVILNGQLENFAIDDGSNTIKSYNYYYSNGNWLTFYSNTSDLNFWFTSDLASSEWIAFQIFVYAPDSLLSPFCPLSNSSKITLKDEFEIIPITSDLFFSPLNFQTKPIKITCVWNITVPPGSGLKINLIIFNKRYSILKVLPTDHDLTFPGVYYFNETNNFNIQYIQEENDIPGTGFAALITAVKLGPLKNETCKLKVTDGINIWGNLDTVNGYSNLQECKYQFLINKFQELQLKVTKLIEKDGDELVLELLNETKININDGSWVVDSSLNGSNLKFLSDGSIVQAGFEVQMQIPGCSCNLTEIIVECDVMGKAMFNPGFAGYCRNMNCTYTVSSFHKCPNNDLLLSFFVSLRAGSSDTLKVYANSTLIKTFIATKIESETYDIHFIPSTNITFNFYSDDKMNGFYKAGNIIIKAFSFIYNPGTTYNLNSTNFAKSFLIDSINDFSSLTIQGPPSGNFLDLFVAPELDNSDESYANLDSIRLYDGLEIQNFVTTLDKLQKSDKDYVLRNIVSQSGSFTLLRLSNNPTFATAFFRLRKEHTTGCSSDENVYSSEGANLTASASPSGTCMFTVLSTATVPFSPTNILTFLNPIINSNQSFGVIAGTDQKFPYFYFNSQTASSWNSVYLFGTSFSFLIPSNQSLEFSYMYTYAQGPKFNTLPAKGVFSSANYANDQTSLPLPNITFIIPANYVMNIEVKYFDFSNASNCYIKQDDEQIPVSEVGQNFVLNSGSVTVVFNENEKGHRGVLFEFEVFIPSTTVSVTSELTTSSTTLTSTFSILSETTETLTTLSSTQKFTSTTSLNLSTTVTSTKRTLIPQTTTLTSTIAKITNTVTPNFETTSHVTFITTSTSNSTVDSVNTTEKATTLTTSTTAGKNNSIKFTYTTPILIIVIIMLIL